MRDLTNQKDVAEFAIELRQFIKDNNLSIKYGDKEYVLEPGWKWAGLNFGFHAVACEPEKSHSDEIISVFFRDFSGVKKPYLATTVESQIKEEEKTGNLVKRIPFYWYSCRADLLNSNKEKVGYGSAICSNLELSKVALDEYSVFSMAQTRAVTKAYKNTFSFLMSLAKFETTPAEEMEEEHLHVSKKSIEQVLEQLEKIDSKESLEKLIEENKEFASNFTFISAVKSKKF